MLKEAKKSSLGVALEYFCKHECDVTVHMNDMQDFDLTVEFDDRVFRVKVKGTVYNVNVDVSKLNSPSKILKKLNDRENELTFIITENNDVYLTPKEEHHNYQL